MPSTKNYVGWAIFIRPAAKINCLTKMQSKTSVSNKGSTHLQGCKINQGWRFFTQYQEPSSIPNIKNNNFCKGFLFLKLTSIFPQTLIFFKSPRVGQQSQVVKRPTSHWPTLYHQQKEASDPIQSSRVGFKPSQIKGARGRDPSSNQKRNCKYKGQEAEIPPQDEPKLQRKGGKRKRSLPETKRKDIKLTHSNITPVVLP